MLDLVQSATAAQATMDSSDRWVTLAFTWTGLRALGVPEESLATFPDEFREGMASRADILGDTGAEPIRTLGRRPGRRRSARDRNPVLAQRRAERSGASPRTTTCSRGPTACAVCRTSTSNATPPFNYAHDHFGFRDRLSQPVMEGSGEEPTPGSGAPLKPGEFILGYPDEEGPVANLPQPEVLSRNGSYMAYRRLEEHVGAVP